jgi:hypothetical protein
MILRHIKMKFGHYRQLMRGRSRVLAKAYSLPATSELRHLDLDDVDATYWGEEKLGEQMQQIIDWYRLMRQAQIIPSKSALPKRAKVLATVRQFLVGILSGIIIAFLGGGLYVLIVPQRGDIWALIIALFLGGLFSPNVLWKMFKSKRP